MYNIRHTSTLPLVILASTALVLLTFFLLLGNPNSSSSTAVATRTPHIHVHKNIQIAQSHCEGTLHPELCVSTLSSFPNLHRKSIAEIISSTVKVAVGEVRDSAHNCSDLRRNVPKLEPIEKRALQDCVELLGETIAELRTALTDLSPKKSASKHYNDIQTLLSAAMTNEDTCLDGLFYCTKNNLTRYVEDNLHTIAHHVSNSLAMLNKIKRTSVSSSEEVFPEYGAVKNGFPNWLKRRERALLQTPVSQTKLDLVVAKDGSGNFTTINEALSAAPNSSSTRFVIYIKEGSYFEYVEVDKKKTMIMFVGDGIGKTKIKGNRNHVDGWTTFRSATVAVVGKGFLAKGITFENYAGPSKHQAVALRSSSDLSAFYQCSFVAYQDTLYVHSLRQFYRDCDVYGTVDFIFGNAAVVLQNCNLYARKPDPNQKNLFTAQGREDPNQNTGISILNCKVEAAADLIPVQSSFKNYLGRPWKEYSRTVVLQSYIGSLIEPAGWLEWNGDFALKTLYYGEYMNRGPGSSTSARVKWPGYRVINSSIEASQFTVGNFIQGGEWLPPTGFPFYLNLTSS
ncbi:pectinesterase-like [Nicotiana tabacum]|uniref:Pectinesterase n=2 Tax=Nicotiana TaxID=4085 RepID=A0A1S3ZQF3_TOBAC|nr:PREDICTED: pectinesterase-like [Nicotiana sylvestris]XP_016466534.1 PREDICTED: pectinesterase-like [Nicotiana tabacum]